jgi:hypothetical protein
MNVILLFLVLPLVAFGQDYKLNSQGQAIPSYVAKVRVLKGKVVSHSKGKAKPAKVGTQLYRNDTLSTGERSIVKIIMVDETFITLGPNSEIRFEDYQFVSKTDRRIHSFVRGQLSSFVKNKAKPGDVVFRAGATTFGVRGTHLLINARTVNQVDVSEFALLSGSAELADPAGSNQLLAPGERVVIAESAVTKKRGADKLALTTAEKEFLAVNDKDDEDLFWPLLPFFDPEGLVAESPLYEVFHSPQETDASRKGEEAPKPAASESEGKGNGAGTFENIRKLNEKLRQ